jgi:hypothetical protein
MSTLLTVMLSLSWLCPQTLYRVKLVDSPSSLHFRYSSETDEAYITGRTLMKSFIPLVSKSNRIGTKQIIPHVDSWTEDFVVSLSSNQQMRQGSRLIYLCIPNFTPACFSNSLPSSGVVFTSYHIMCGYVACVPECRGFGTQAT